MPYIESSMKIVNMKHFKKSYLRNTTSSHRLNGPEGFHSNSE